SREENGRARRQDKSRRGRLAAYWLLPTSGAGHPSRRSAPDLRSSSADAGRYSVSGRIGPLHVDVSERRAVVAFAGRPDAERRGRSPAAPFRSAPYDALGYRCSRGADRDAFSLVSGGPFCRTVFFIDSRSGRLGTFYTSDP